MEKLQLDELDFSKHNGLIPVVALSSETGEVLMQAYANLEALKLTQSSGYAHYWSRSRGKLWKKGKTSGNLQKIEKILVDCESCPLSETTSCEDCLVTFICDRDPRSAVVISLDEWRSMRSMTKAGLLPKLRNPIITIKGSH